MTSSACCSRRTLLAGSAAAAAWPGLAAEAARGRSFFDQHGLPIGLQLHSLEEDVRRDLDATLAQVADIGYRTVELSSLMNRQGPPAAVVATALTKAGLSCPSMQLAQVQDLEKIFDDAQALGCAHAVTSALKLPEGARTGPGEKISEFLKRVTAGMSHDDWKRSADDLNRVGAALKARSLQFSYHNHAYEFARLSTGETGYDILLRETNPALVSFELDVGWAAAAGRDPVQLLRTNPRRFLLLHIKDLKPALGTGAASPMVPADVGYGVLDWPSLLRAAYEAGVRHFFVEREPPFAQRPIDSARRSFQFLRALVA